MGPQDSLIGFANQMPAVQMATMVIAYLIGFVTAASGVFYMAFGGGRNSQYGHGMGYGLSMTIGGVAIMNVAPFIAAFSQTLLGADPLGWEWSPNITQLGSVSGSGQAAWMASLVFILVAIGWIFSVWGLVNLSHAGSRREKGMAAGISRIIAGVILANPVVSAYILGATLGIEDVVVQIIPPP